jgi:hypothetical protein
MRLVVVIVVLMRSGDVFLVVIWPTYPVELNLANPS